MGAEFLEPLEVFQKQPQQEIQTDHPMKTRASLQTEIETPTLQFGNTMLWYHGVFQTREISFEAEKWIYKLSCKDNTRRNIL